MLDLTGGGAGRDRQPRREEGRGPGPAAATGGGGEEDGWELPIASSEREMRHREE